MASELVIATLCLTDHELPMVVESSRNMKKPKHFQPNAKSASLGRARFRSDSENSSVIKSNRSKERQKRARVSNLQYPSPACAGCCNNIKKSIFRNSIGDGKDSNHAELFIGNMLPIFAQSRVDKGNPVQNVPAVKANKPGQTDLCRSIDRARCALSKTTRDDPIRSREKKERGASRCTNFFSNVIAPMCVK